jgi:hypothetical protein
VLFGPSGAILHAYDAQFGEENGHFVYRRSGKGEAYRITQEAYEDLRAAYIRQYRRTYLLFMALTLTALSAILAGMMMLDVPSDSLAFYVILGATIAPLIALFVHMNHRATTAPARLFEREIPVAPALDREERRRRALGRISYGQLLLAPVVGLVLLFSLSDDVDIWSGAGRLAWLIPAGFSLLAAVQAWRKFEVERTAE